MTTLKCLIVDDEPLGIDLVANFLGRLCITNITRCENGIEAFQRLQEETFDLIFLDIEMPMLSGIELLKSLSQRPAVVITTAYRDYAVEGFELDVLDYLVKPFSFARFMRTMEKVGRLAGVPALGNGMRRIGEEGSSVKNVNQAGAATGTAVPGKAETTESSDIVDRNFLFLKAGKDLTKIRIAEIRYIESRRDYIQVYTTKGDWLCHQSLTDITSRLPPENFFRLHRSYTVAVDKIDLFRNNTVHIQGKLIPVSRENRQELRRRLSR